MRDPRYANALKHACARFAARPGFDDYSAYLCAKDRGLKIEAGRAAEAFAARLDGASSDDAIEIVRALDEARRDFEDAPGLIPHPVAMAAARACERWEEDEPSKAEPLLIRAWLQNDPWLISEALKRQPGDPRALRAEIRRVLDWVSFAFHHIGEGAVIGDLSETREGIGELRDLCERLDEAGYCAPVLAEAAFFESVLDGLAAWSAAGRPGDFAAFMRGRGVELRETPVYPFKP